MTKAISTQFDPEVRAELDYYRKHHYELEDLQDGLGIGSALKFLKDTEGVEGDILELGIFRGGTTTLMAKFLKKINSKKKIYACDAFIGLPYDDRFSSRKGGKGWLSDTSEQIAREKFEKFGVSNKIEIVKGLFEETLYQKLADKKFSFILVDCDLYDATKYSLKYAYPRLSTNGIVMFDDYYRFDNDNEPPSGETKAVDEFCAENEIDLSLNPVPHITKL